MNYFFIENTIEEIIDLQFNKKISHGEIIDIVRENYSNDPFFAWENFNPDVNDKSEFPINNKLLNIPFGTKDIFNTSKFPTCMGSEIWKGFEPGNNARVVDSLLNSGAINVGKTVTAEFAVHELNKTLNPFDIQKMPGTSSSGSAVSVATGTVPFAIGTQTAGSISRPSSYCGVWGFKPSFGLIPRTGVLKTTDSLDQVGFLTTNALNLRTIFDCMRVKGPNYPFVFDHVDNRDEKDFKKEIRVGFIKTYIWNNCKDYVKKEFNNFLNILDKEKNINIEEIIFPDEYKNAHEIHSNIYNKSLSYYFKKEREFNPGNISKIMNKMIEIGENISFEQYDRALNDQISFTKNINKLFSTYDIILSPTTVGSAPNRDEKEIDDCSLLWTLSLIPSLSAPLFRCPEQMPFNIHFLSSRWKDFNIITFIEYLVKKEIISPKCQII